MHLGDKRTQGFAAKAVDYGPGPFSCLFFIGKQPHKTTKYSHRGRTHGERTELDIIIGLDSPEYPVSIKIEKLDEGVYLATSDSLQGLVAQGMTIAETVEIAKDVARKLIEMRGVDLILGRTR